MSRFHGKLYIAQKEPIPWAAIQKYRTWGQKSGCSRQTGEAKNNKGLTLGQAFIFFGSPDMTRTCDPLVNSQLLYRLSYRGICRCKKLENAY